MSHQRPASVVAACLLGTTLAAAPSPEEPAVTRPPRPVVAPGTWRPPRAADHVHDLSTGARLVFAPDSTLPLVDIVVGLRGGVFRDSPEQPGLTYLTTQAMPRGGAGDLAADQLDTLIDRQGARMTVRWAPLFTAFGLSSPTWSLEQSLAAFAAVLRRPRFEWDRVEALLGNLEEGLARRNDDPVEVLFREWEWLLYGDHPVNRPIRLGDFADVDRSRLVAAHSRLWQPRDLVVAVSGDLDLEAARDAAERITAPLGEPKAETSPGWPPAGPGPGAAAGVYRLVRDVGQAKILLGHRLTPSAAEPSERWPLLLLAEVLGGTGAVARIQGRLRTAEGLVYRSSVRLEPGELWPGEVHVFLETRPEATGRALTLVLEEIERVRRRPIPTAELEAARRNLLGQARRSFDTGDEIGGYLAESLLYGRSPDYWSDYVDGVAAAGPDDVLRVAERHLHPENLAVLVLGPDPGPNDPLAAIVGGETERLSWRDPGTLEAVAPEADD